MKLPRDQITPKTRRFIPFIRRMPYLQCVRKFTKIFITCLLLRSYWIGSKERVLIILHRCQLNYQSSRMSRRSSKDTPIKTANLLAKDKWNTGRKYRIKKKTEKSLGRNSCNLFCLNRKTNTTKRHQSSAR